MALFPTKESVIGKFVNGRNAQDDFLQLADNHGGTVFGWIDAAGHLQGSLLFGTGVSFVSSLPALCTPGLTQIVELSVAPYTAYYCSAANTWTAISSGTVTSVGFVGDGTVLSATPSTPVTTSGNVSATLLSQSAGFVLAGPVTGAAAAPTFRALVQTDMPPGVLVGGTAAVFATNFGVKADTLNVVGCSGTSGTNTVTCTGGSFTSADIGKIIWASGTPNATPDLPQTTITGVTSSTIVTVGTNLIRNMTAGEATYGHDDTAAINAAWAALVALPNCGTLTLPAGGMIISSAVMYTYPSKCNFDQNSVGASIEGQGLQTTLFYPAPNFTYANVNGPCVAGGNGGCFGPGPVNMSNLGLYSGYGGNLVGTNTYNGVWLSVQTPGNLQNVSLSNFTVPGNMSSVAVTSGNAWLFNTQIFGFSGNGSSGCTTLNVNANATVLVYNSFLNSSCGSDGANLISTGGNLILYGITGQCAVQNCMVVTAGHTTIIGGGGPAFNSLLASGVGTTVSVNGYVNTFSTAPLTGVLNATTGAKITVSGSTIKNAAAGTNYIATVDSTSTFIDGCGNSFLSNTATALVTSGGLFVPCPSTTYKGSQSFPAVSGTGACATITTQVGNMFTGTLKCTGSTGASTIVLTPGLTAPNGWNCSASDLTTSANTLNQSASSTASCTLSSATITANDVITFRLTQF
jgi:hypothetical protein